MAYNFLELTNDVLKKTNNTVLTSSNFASAVGVHADMKNAVNDAIRNINTAEFNWPFNHVTKSLVLTPAQVRYDFEDDAKSVDFNTFRIQGSDALNITTRKLFPIDYEEYIENFSDMEYRADKYDKIPTMVFRSPEFKFGIVPAPNLAYTLDYEYYQLPVDLDAYDDVPSIPEIFRYVIFNGAMVEAYLFRGESENSDRAEVRHKQGIKDMRKIFINRYGYVRSTAVTR